MKKHLVLAIIASCVVSSTASAAIIPGHVFPQARSTETKRISNFQAYDPCGVTKFGPACSCVKPK